MNAPTPGPWAIRDIATCSYYIGPASDGGAPSVAFMLSRVGVPDSQIAADARLIAAAPDMLEALRSAVSSIEQLVKLDRIPTNNKGLRDARGAIALATGSKA